MTTWLGNMGWLVAVAALAYVIYYISRKVRSAGAGGANALRSARGRDGMSDREAALVAQARADALGARPTPLAPAPVADNEVSKKTELSAPGGIMKSAGDPRVRKAFAQAMKEVETKSFDSGLWAMALVECNGDEKMARLTYMKARAADLLRLDTRGTESTQPAQGPPDVRWPGL
ncbi:MAG: hypothetical protein IT518_07945 [Burkholderiales bacterium]|nr:hypothetical protein [Burkholderiales bacterium]